MTVNPADPLRRKELLDRRLGGGVCDVRWVVLGYRFRGPSLHGGWGPIHRFCHLTHERQSSFG